MKKIITYILEVKCAFNNKKYPYTPTHRHIRFSSSSASPQSHHLPVPSLLAWQSGSTFVTQLMKHLPIQSRKGHIKKANSTTPPTRNATFPKTGHSKACRWWSSSSSWCWGGGWQVLVLVLRCHRELLLLGRAKHHCTAACPCSTTFCRPGGSGKRLWSWSRSIRTAGEGCRPLQAVARATLWTVSPTSLFVSGKSNEAP